MAVPPVRSRPRRAASARGARALASLPDRSPRYEPTGLRAWADLRTFEAGLLFFVLAQCVLLIMLATAFGLRLGRGGRRRRKGGPFSPRRGA